MTEELVSNEEVGWAVVAADGKRRRGM